MHLISSGPRSSATDVLSMEELIEDSEPAPRIARSGDDDAIIYTGGTTGYPKGVVWSHFAAMNQRANGTGESTAPIAEHVAAVAGAPQARSLVIAPMMHASGFFGAAGALTGGGCVVFCESRSLNPQEILRLIGQYRIASFSVVGDAVAKPLLGELDAAAAAGLPYDLSSVEVILNTGVVWSAAVKQAFLRHGEFVIRDGIGSTEGAGFATAESRRATRSRRRASS